MSLAGFRASQEQFFFAVTFFPRPMAALIGRIPNPRARLDILHNLVEEHGEFDEERFHHTTFQQFLRSIGSDPQQLENASPYCFAAFVALRQGVRDFFAGVASEARGFVCTIGRRIWRPAVWSADKACA